MNDAFADLYRAEFGQLVASVTRVTGDISQAEDIAQEAFLKARSHWQNGVIPEHAGAWLMKTAKNKAIDLMRRSQRWQLEPVEREQQIQEDHAELEQQSALMQDDMARLIFTCCHPALNIEARVALCLSVVCGLKTDEIARAFIVPSATMSQRLWRAKTKIRDAGIAYVVPDDDVLPMRLDSVLTVIYLIFNEGWLASSGPSAIRLELVNEAIRLCRLLLVTIQADARIQSLLALMLLQHSRRAARFDKSGALIRLSEQNRELWHDAEIAEGSALLHKVFEQGHGRCRYALMAAIAAMHAKAPSSESTNWGEIVALYDALMAVDSSPVVALNRAVAIAERDGALAGLQEIDSLCESVSLQRYHLFHAARGEMLLRLQRRPEAIAAFERALAVCAGETEQKFLQIQIEAAREIS